MHIASAFYRLLLKMLQMQGLYKAYALITVPNEASESLYRKAGFETIGIFRQTGFKLNEWRDVAFMEKNIADVSGKTIGSVCYNRFGSVRIETTVSE